MQKSLSIGLQPVAILLVLDQREELMRHCQMAFRLRLVTDQLVRSGERFMCVSSKEWWQVMTVGKTKLRSV